MVRTAACCPASQATANSTSQWRAMLNQAQKHPTAIPWLPGSWPYVLSGSGGYAFSCTGRGQSRAYGTWKTARRPGFHGRCVASLRADPLATEVVPRPTVDEARLGLVLEQSGAESGRWDALAAAGPVVHRGVDGIWHMYYYGRGADMWGCGVKAPPAPPIGWCGLAQSDDGIHWEKVKGPEKGGAVLGPREEDKGAFDSVCVGCSDAVFGAEGGVNLYVFGGDLTEVSMGQMMGVLVSNRLRNVVGGMVAGAVGQLLGKLPMQTKGFKWRIGLATSTDGIHFSRQTHPILDVGGEGEWDSRFVAFPKVVPPHDATTGAQWLMTYHSLAPDGQFYVGVAVSDDGVKWTKKGKVLGPGREGAWDDAGIGTRHVLRIGNRYWMFYEGVSAGGTHAIGLAHSEDGLNWTKDQKAGSEPGGPIFRPRADDVAWDNKNLGTPHVVALPDGSFRMYYVGVSKKLRFNIGMAVSDGSDFRIWTRFGR